MLWGRRIRCEYRFLAAAPSGFLAPLSSPGVGLDRGNDGSGAAREARTAGDDHATMLRRCQWH
jgi:hypothetical protein